MDIREPKGPEKNLPKIVVLAKSKLLESPKEVEEAKSSNSQRKKLGKVSDIELITRAKSKTSLFNKIEKIYQLGSVHKYPWAIKLGWGFCFFLIVHLFFTERGIVDYWKKNKEFKQLARKIGKIKRENNALQAYVTRANNDRKYQKQLVRNRLGQLARDEYVILFLKAPEKAAPSK